MKRIKKLQFNVSQENMIKRYVVLFLILLVYISLCYGIYGDKIKDRVLSFNESQAKPYEELKNGDEIEQEIKLYTRDISKITLYTATFGNNDAGNGYISLTLSGEKGDSIAKKKISLSDVKDNAQLKISFDKPFYRNGNKNAKLVMRLDGMSESDKITFYVGNGESDHVKINGKSQSFALRYDITSNSMDYYSAVYLLCAIIIGILIIVMYWYLFIANKKTVHTMFLIVAIAMGLVYFAIIPEYETPDELRHMETAYSLSNRLYGESSNGDVFMRRNDYDNLYSQDDMNLFHKMFDREYYNKYYYGIIHDHYVDNTMVDIAKTPLNAKSYLYIFSAAGILLGRILGLNSAITFLLGAFLNYLLYVVGIFYAIKKLPKGKTVLFLIAILPITLQQASSYSYDCIIIVSAFVFISLCFRLLFEKLNWFDISVLIISALSMAIAKSGAYLPILMVLLIPIISKWKKEKKIDKIAMGSFIVIILCIIINRFLISTGNVSGLGSNSNLSWLNEESYSIGYLLSNPDKWLVILWSTIINKGSEFFYTAFGGELGWLEINVPWWVIIILFLSIVVVCLTEHENMKFEKWIKAAIWLISVATVGTVCGGLLLCWTPISSNEILGVQGRYFLPFMPLLFWGMQTESIRIRESLYNKAIYMTVLMQPFIVYAFIAVELI